MPPCEHDVAAVADIPADGMLGVIAGEQSVLLTRVGSAVYAVGGTCPHARGPLVEGICQNDHVICPWHPSFGFASWPSRRLFVAGLGPVRRGAGGHSRSIPQSAQRLMEIGSHCAPPLLWTSTAR